jgi:hypothetical protein
MNLVKEVEMENLYGKMDRVMKEIGNLAKRMDTESGNPQKEITMKENGKIIFKMEKDVITIKDVQSIEGILKIL